MNDMHVYIESLIQQKSILGMVGAELNGTDVHTFQMGTIDGVNPVNEQFLYDIASLTKLFTGTRILQLIESNHCALNDPIQQYLPQFKSSEITIEHCLLHRSGLAASCSGRYTMDAQHLKESILNCDDLINPVDEVMVYSCINFIVLSYVIEAIDGDFETSLKTHILNPCSMTHTQFNPSDSTHCVPSSMHEGISQCGVVDDTTARVLGGVSGNAGLFSTRGDLIKFVQALLNHTIISESTMDLISASNKDGRALVWNRYEFENHSTLYHTGYTGPSILIIPELKKALILLTNRNYPKPNTDYVDQRLEIFRKYISNEAA